MNDWLVPTCIFLIGTVIWTVAVVFIKKQLSRIFCVVGGVVAVISIAMLLQKGYYAFGGTLLCIVLLIVVVAIGFTPRSKNPPSQGPLQSFIGKEGTAITELNPKGKVKIGDEVMLATTEGIFLAEGESIRVVRTGSRMVVVTKSDE